MEIIVVGAGIVGVSCAIWLQRSGHQVTLVDRDGPASGASHGNAGVLAAGEVVPVTTPDIWTKGPGMLLDRDSPLFVKWSYLPRMLPFLARYMGHASDAHVRRYGAAMAPLLSDSYAQHMHLAAGTAAQRFVHGDDYCTGYATRADFEADRYEWDRRRALGGSFEVCSGQDYAQVDPAFGAAFEVVVRCHDHGRISDPGAYVKALAQHFVDEGGALELAEVVDLDVDADGAIAALQTRAGEMRADRIVLAMGAWSGAVARKLGVKVPLESERGYHIEFMNPSVMPKQPMMVASGKFVLTPMEGRLRAAGVLEFGGLDHGPSRAPFAMLRRQVARVLPDLRCDHEVEWMGHRPATADSLPLIGANDPGGRSYSAFGHQHVGLTSGPKTGRIIADLINATPPNIDLSPFDPMKYRR